MKKACCRGWTLIELVIVITVSSIMATGIAAIFIPQINSYFMLVSDISLQSASADVMKVILEGDSAARGLRFANPASPITTATEDSLTYQYYNLNQTSSDMPHTVVITYDAGNRVVTRTIDGGAVDYAPYYVGPGGNFHIDPLETDFFKYYDSAGTQLTGTITVTNIERVNVAIETSYAGGMVQFGGAKHRLKTGAFIKRNT